MKNICFLIGNMDSTGGTERVTSLIANQFIESNRVFILSLSEGKNPAFNLNSKIHVDSLFNHKVSMKKNFLSCILRIRKYIQDNKIDTLIVVDSISCVFTVPALIGLNVNHICWEHFNFKVNLGVKFRDLGRKLAARYCDYIVTLTERDRELWIDGLKNVKAKIIAIPNPTPFESINHTPNLDFKTVLSVGRLTYQKGFDLLLDAWALVCKQNSDWTLKIVGGGEDEQTLKNQAKELGIENRVIFVPPTKNIAEHYKTASFYCMSSRFEGLPMVLLEAQSYGLPIVSFDCDTGPAEVIENGKNGFLVPSFNIVSFSEKIFDMIGSDYKSMTENSKQNVLNFLLDNVVLKWNIII